jgi:hypothetical protein
MLRSLWERLISSPGGVFSRVGSLDETVYYTRRPCVSAWLPFSFVSLGFVLSACAPAPRPLSARCLVRLGRGGPNKHCAGVQRFGCAELMQGVGRAPSVLVAGWGPPPNPLGTRLPWAQ